MTDWSLGAALEVMHGARSRFSTLQASLTRVVDHVVEERALYRAARQRLRERSGEPGPLSAKDEAQRRANVAAREKDAEQRGTVTTRLRLAVQIPERLRLEEEITYDGRPVTKVDVLDGHVWRGYEPGRGARFQPGGYEGSHAFHEVGPLLDPSTLIADQDLEAVGEATWAGRPAIRVMARPRPLLFGQHGALQLMLYGGTEHEVLVDAERGVILRLEARCDGEAFRVFELGDIVFDAELPAATWEVQAPDGQTPQPLEPRHNHPISLTDALADAPCKLFLPERSPAGSELSIMMAPDRRDPAKAQAILFAYSWTGGTHRVQIHEAPRRSSFLDEIEGWQEITRGGQRMLARDGPAEPSGMHLRRYVTLERDGTHIQISGNLALDDLIEMGATMAPVDATPPTL